MYEVDHFHSTDKVIGGGRGGAEKRQTLKGIKTNSSIKFSELHPRRGSLLPVMPRNLQSPIEKIHGGKSIFRSRTKKSLHTNLVIRKISIFKE